VEFKEFSELNRERCEAPNGFNHSFDAWDLSDWFLAFIGEAGEAANVAKKLNRVRDGIPGNTESVEELRQKLADELADAFIYFDLVVQSEGFDLETIVMSKFEKTSKKIGYAETCKVEGCDEPVSNLFDDGFCVLHDGPPKQPQVQCRGCHKPLTNFNAGGYCAVCYGDILENGAE